MRFSGCVAVSAGLIGMASCKPSMRGNLQITAGGSPVTIVSALYVPAGTDGFRVEISSVKRDCDWARAGGVGALARGEVLGALDVAPVIGSDGVSRWNVVGAGWTSDARAEHETSGNVGNVAWAADVSNGAGCDRHIKIANDEEKTLHVHGDFDVICCGPVPPAGPAPMTAKIGDKTFPLTSAWAKQDKDAAWHVRVSRGLPSCSDDTTGADLFVDFYTPADFAAATSFSIGGQVVPRFGYVAMTGPFPAIARANDDLAVNGTIHATRPTDSRVLDVELHGRVPLTTCAPRPH